MSEVKSLPKLFTMINHSQKGNNQSIKMKQMHMLIHQQPIYSYKNYYHQLQQLQKVRQYRIMRKKAQKDQMQIEILKNRGFTGEKSRIISASYDQRQEKLPYLYFKHDQQKNNFRMKNIISNKHVQTQIEDIVKNKIPEYPRKDKNQKVHFNSFVNNQQKRFNNQIKNHKIHHIPQKKTSNQKYLSNNRYNNPEQQQHFQKYYQKGIPKFNTTNQISEHRSNQTTQFEVRNNKKNSILNSPWKSKNGYPQISNIVNENQNPDYINKRIEQLHCTEQFKPKSNIINKIDIQTFQIKKYQNGVYFGHLDEEGKKSGKGVLFYHNGRVYQGDFEDDAKNGKGLQTYSDGSYYQGQFKNSLKEGKGKFQWTNGQIYEGNWLKGYKHGSGFWKSNNNQSYIGQWYEGIIQGYGVHIMVNGDRYQGDFLNSQKNGHGTLRYFNGDTYIGCFKKNKAKGLGEIHFKNGDYYKGSFLNGLRHGKGMQFSKSGSVYQGQFKNNKKCGYGELVDQNYLVYFGQFQNDLRHGYGELYQKDSLLFQGYWVNDIPMNEEIIQEEIKSKHNQQLPIIINHRHHQPQKVVKIKNVKQKQHNVKLDILSKKSAQKRDKYNNLQSQQQPIKSSKRSCGCLKKH